MGEIGKFKDDKSYPDLELSKAIAIAEKIQNEFEGKVTASQLAKLFGIEVRGGGFANRVKDVAAYGLIEGKGEYKLTPLGTRVAQNPNDADARREAFLHVPLFNAMHATFKGKLNPENEMFVSRLQHITESKPSEASIRAARLRNHYNEALPYLLPEKFQGEPMKVSSGSFGSGSTPSQSGGPTIPQDYERLIGTDFVIGTKKDLEALEMLEAQVGPWIAALKRKLGGSVKRDTFPENISQ